MSQPMDSGTKKHDINALEALYIDAESCDQEVFSEMRSNLLLISGEHYSRKNSNFYRRIRDSKDLNDQQKLRLTKNHTQFITKTYANNIISLAPGVGFEPKNESELSDQKAAELHHSVWLDLREKGNLEEKEDEWCDDFIGLGEVATKIFWDPSAGKLKAFHQKVDDTGAPMFGPSPGMDPMTGQEMQGALIPDPSRPVYAGDFVYEDLYGFNLLRAPEARDMKMSHYLIIRKMVPKDKALLLAGDDESKKKFVQEGSDRTFVVFDAMNTGYRQVKGDVLIKEYYFRPCAQYPKGYFYIATGEGILAEGELPGGIFPIVWQYFDKMPTMPRGRGPVKIMRPYQAEINRAASKMAEHQITLGDDKLLIQNGTKVAAGIALPGVRSINYTGMEPGILQGRDGSQYLAYMQSQIEELYRVMGVAEDSMPENGQIDPYSRLFMAASKKKRFQRYIKRYERFLVNVAKISLSLAKIHLPDDAVIYAAGKKEQVNIAEFKNSNELCYEVKISAQSDDVDTKMGQQLMLNHVLQYVGPQMDKESIGKLIKAMPYANLDDSFSDLTLDYECATNDILALDRGELPPVHEYDDHVYEVKRLVSRKKQADFKFLSPQIQNNYANLISQHEQAEAMRQQKIMAAKSEYIPSGGYMVVCDLYVGDPQNPDKTRRARIPYESLAWLIQQLESQGQSLQQLESMNQGAVAQMADMISRKPGAPPDGMGGTPNSGNAMPGGASNGSGQHHSVAGRPNASLYANANQPIPSPRPAGPFQP